MLCAATKPERERETSVQQVLEDERRRDNRCNKEGEEVSIRATDARGCQLCSTQGCGWSWQRLVRLVFI